VPCEWAAGGLVILVWNWCLVNGQLMTSYPSMGLVPCEWAAVLVWNQCWFGTSAGLELKFYEVDIFKF